MDEALRKSGDWPNVAIPAGSDPHEVMREHGAKPCANGREDDGWRSADYWRRMFEEEAMKR